MLSLSAEQLNNKDGDNRDRFITFITANYNNNRFKGRPTYSLKAVSYFCKETRKTKRQVRTHFIK